MLVAKTVPNPKAVSHLCVNPATFDDLLEHFYLDKFDPRECHVMVELDDSNYLFLNVRDPDRESIHANADRLAVLKTLGRFCGYCDGPGASSALVINLPGQTLDWTPLGGVEQPTLRYKTVLNSSSYKQYSAPTGQ